MRRKLTPALGCGCAALSYLAFSPDAAAQAVFAPPPADALAVPPPAAAAPTGPILAPPPTVPPTEAKPLLEWGPVKFRPNLLYRVLYGDGIPVAPGENLTTVINEVYVGLLFEVGRHWTLNWTPSFQFYSNNRFRDVIDQNVSLAGGTTYENWTLGLSQSYITSDQPLVETGTQTSTETFDTGLSARYEFNDRLSAELGLSQEFRSLAGNSVALQLQDSKSWSTMDWLNYQVWPRLGLAIGGGGGYTDLSTGSAIVSEQLQGRVTLRLGDKLSLIASGGMSDMQFPNDNRPSLLTPVFSVTAAYQMFEPTTLSLNASQTVTPAYFANQVNQSTTVGGGISQRFLKKLTLSLSGGYSIMSYAMTTSAGSGNAETHYTFLTARVSAPFLKRGTASLLYQASNNSSSQGGLTYSSTQVGLELGYRF